MPKWVCSTCSHEFWGWSAYYSRKIGGELSCPDCDGVLVERKDDGKRTDIITRLLTGTADF